MEITRKIIFISAFAIFGLTPIVYSLEFKNRVEQLRDQLAARTRGSKWSLPSQGDISFRFNQMKGQWGGRKRSPKGSFSGKARSFLVNSKNRVEARGSAKIRAAKRMSNVLANSYHDRSVKNGEAAGRLWVNTSSFNPELRGPGSDILDNIFNDIRKEGEGETGGKQFTSGLSNSWRRIFSKKQDKKPKDYTNNTEIPTGFDINSSDLHELNETSESLPYNDIKDFEVTSASTVNVTTDNQSDIFNFSNEKIIKNLKENRNIPFVKNQTLGDLIVYTEIASKNDPNNGQVLYIVDKDRGFAVEYKESEPFVINFNDGRESVFLSIDEDSDTGSLKVRDSNGIVYDYREKYVDGSKVITIRNPFPVEF